MRTRRLTLVRVAPSRRFSPRSSGDDAIGTGQTEKATRKGLGSGSQIVGQYVPEKETDDRHGAFEDPEDQRDSQSQRPVHTGDADASRRTEIVQAY